MILKSESEKPILAFKGAVAATLRSKHGVEVVPEASYKDSQANGLAEHAVREGGAKVRPVVFGPKERYGRGLAPEHHPQQEGPWATAPVRSGPRR